MEQTSRVNFIKPSLTLYCNIKNHNKKENKFIRYFLENIYSESDISSKSEEETLVELKTFQSNLSTPINIIYDESLLFPHTATNGNMLSI